MAFHTFGPGLALDDVTGRGIPAVVARLVDAETGDPVQAYTMDDEPIETAVSTNRYGYFGYFQVPDTVRRLRLTFGGLTLEHTAWELLTEAAQDAAEALQAALDALQAAQEAADLVEAPADEVIATLLQNAASLTAIAGDARWISQAESDAVVAQLIGEDGTETQQAGDGRYAKRGELFVNVRDFGAVGDGVTNDTPAFTAALEAARDKSAFGGCTVTALPAGDFNFGSLARVYSDTTLDLNFSTIRRTAGPGYVMFAAYSGGPAGYGSGGHDITLRNIRFQGDFANGRGCGNIFHHVDRLTFDNCTFTEALGTGGHPGDIMGCRDVVIVDCAGYGRYEVAGRAYVEMFQLDHSTRSGAGGELPEASTAWDGLPCVNVSMTRCKSEPITIGETTYLAPRLIGSHSRVANLRHRGVYLEDIRIVDSGRTDEDENYRGWIHFTHTEDVTIDGYTAINTRDEDAAVLGFGSVATTYTLDTVASSSPTLNSDAGPVGCDNIRIKNLHAIGNKKLSLSSLVLIAGRSGAPANNVSIDMQAENFSSGNLAQYDSGATMVDVSFGHVVDLMLKCDGVRRMVNVESSRHLKMDLQGRNITHSAVRASTCRDVTYNNADLYDVSCAGYFSGVIGLTQVGNSAYANAATTVPYESMYSYTGCQDLLVANNRTISEQGSAIVRAHNFYGTTTNSSSSNNQARGISVNQVASNSTVTVQGTIAL